MVPIGKALTGSEIRMEGLSGMFSRLSPGAYSSVRYLACVASEWWLPIDCPPGHTHTVLRFIAIGRLSCGIFCPFLAIAEHHEMINWSIIND